MNRTKKQSLMIVAGALVLVFLISFTSVQVYLVALEEAKANHQVQQVAIARAAASGLDYWVNHFEEEMHILSSLPAVQYLNVPDIQHNIDYFYRHVKEQGVQNIIIFGPDGQAIVSTSNVMSSWITESAAERLEKAEDLAERSTWYSEVQPLNKDTPEQLYFLELTPIIQTYKDTHYSQPNGQLVGLVGYLISFDWLVKQHVEPLEVNELDFAWIIDGRGRLLFHSKHPEMEHRSILDSSKYCLTCHSNFEAQRAILYEDSGVREYQVGAEPKRLMAFAPVVLNGERWTVVMSTLQSEATALLQSKFRFFFIHIGVIIVIILVAGWLLYYFNAKRIRAEEEQRRVTEKEEMQEQINHAAKLASIGELVDSVAHEINTPTGIISVQADAILMQDNSSKELRDEITLIKEQTRRIHKYTRSLLDFSKRMPFRPRPADICKTVDHCIFLIGHRFRAKKIEIIKNYDSNLPNITIDPGQIEQVVINILNNAVDAIGDRGHIKISISKKSMNGKDGLELSISDNGSGIEPKALSEIFNPFYTTKEGAKGTGLGLSISRAIILRHRGHISVESEPGQGAIFRIHLPFEFSEEPS